MPLPPQRGLTYPPTVAGLVRVQVAKMLRYHEEGVGSNDQMDQRDGTLQS